MPVFDEFERSDASPASHSESHALFLNRVHTPYWAAVRGLIEDWFLRLPDAAKADLGKRLRSTDDRQFHAAFWELYVHETLLRAGYRLTVHPPLAHTDRRPDYLAEGDDESFYVECRVVSDSDDKITAERRRHQVYDALDRLDTPNFFLWIEVEGEGASDLRTKTLRRDLEHWLSTLDPDEVGDLIESEGSILGIAPFEWQHEDWHLVFRPWPKSPELRGSDGVRPIGMSGPGQAYMIDDVTPLKKALEDKGRAYGALGLPYVIAIRTTSFSTDDFDVLGALYGSDQVRLTLGPHGETVTESVRAPDGYWYGGHEWKHPNVSAVLVATRIYPWTVAGDCPTLWLHPEPEFPIGAGLPVWQRAFISKGELRRVAATVAPNEFFEIPPDWPGGDPFDAYPE